MTVPYVPSEDDFWMYVILIGQAVTILAIVMIVLEHKDKDKDKDKQ